MARILVSGSSGFIGGPLTFYLNSQSHTVIRLVRSISEKTSDSIVWKPEEGKAEIADFEGFDAVIHLAGEPLSIGRWSKAKQKQILLSRTVGTKFLSQLISKLKAPPKLFLSASAIGFYGDRGEEILTEESLRGSGFLANVCSQWEMAGTLEKVLGCRVVHARFGMVLGSHGGALQKIVPLFKFCLGGKLGSGRQWLSWVHLDDLVRSIDYILNRESLSGFVNITSPNPVRQEEFAQILGEFLHRPHCFSIPAWAIRLGLGRAASELILSSSRVIPAKLLSSGFLFQYPFLLEALHKAIK